MSGSVIDTNVIIKMLNNDKAAGAADWAALHESADPGVYFQFWPHKKATQAYACIAFLFISLH